MITLAAPTELQLGAFLHLQRDRALSYPDVGATRDGPLPAGYRVDRRSEAIGRNWDVARHALECWEMHAGAGVRVVPDEPAREGLTIGLVVHAGVWMTSACRVIYRIDEPDRFGFAYGTLADHPVAGEERFLLTRDGGTVTFELLAFSRGRSLLFRLGAPIARAKQLQLGEAYIQALRRIAS